MIDAHIGDLITLEGGPLVWQTIDTSVYGNEKITSDIQFTLDMVIGSTSNASSSVIMDYIFDDMNDFDETGFYVDSYMDSGTASLEPKPAGGPDNLAVRLFAPGEPMWLSRTIDCDEILDIAFDYWFPSVGKLTVFLDGVELTSLESIGDLEPAFSRLEASFVLADYGLTAGEMLLELELANLDGPDPEVFLDNLRVTTVPEPACGVMLLVGGLGLLRAGRRRTSVR